MKVPSIRTPVPDPVKDPVICVGAAVAVSVTLIALVVFATIAVILRCRTSPKSSMTSPVRTTFHSTPGHAGENL